MTGESEVVVVGGGLVGLACAYSLAMTGVQPLVIDAGQAGRGASWGNAGWIAFAPVVVAPVPAPGVLLTSLRWLIQRDSPLRLVPRLDLDYLRWLLAFVGKCSSDAASAGLQAILALNAETAELFDELERDGLEFEMEQDGLLVVYRDPKNLESAWESLSSFEGGLSATRLSRDETLTAEPTLRPSTCAGAIYYAADRQLRPDRLSAALTARLERMGVEIRTDSPCIEMVREGRRVTALRTPSDTLRKRAYVLAAGPATSQLARQVGVRIPIEGGRGYSFDVDNAELPLRTPVKLYEGRLALTPFREFTRVAGMMELGARTSTVRRAGIDTMNRVGTEAFQTWIAKAPRDAWAGLRSMTPDGLPVIGQVDGIENLHVASGHGLLGVTLSLRTGKAVAQQISQGRIDDPVLLPFAPSRFTRFRVRDKRLQSPI